MQQAKVNLLIMAIFKNTFLVLHHRPMPYRKAVYSTACFQHNNSEHCVSFMHVHTTYFILVYLPLSCLHLEVVRVFHKTASSAIVFRLCKLPHHVRALQLQLTISFLYPRIACRPIVSCMHRTESFMFC